MKRNILLLLAIIWLFRGRASLTTPSGGPKDLRPPLLVQSLPKNNQTNFKGKTVELTFDELIKLNNPKEEIIISPSPGKDIEIKVKGTKAFITSNTGWKDSTTYSLLFREGIQDVTESNIPVNLKLAFSTGNDIDSLRISGKVEELLKGKPQEKITVAIYQQDTFDIFTDIPNYFTKTDKQGNFTLENIKAGDYKIYAFDDKNKNLKVESRTERYGFLTRSLAVSRNIDSLTLPLIMIDSRPLKISSIRNVGTITRLRFNKYVTHYAVEVSREVTNSFGDDQTEINFWNPDSMGDSLQLHLSASDSLNNQIDSVFYIKRTAIKPIKENFKWSLHDPIVEAETGKFTVALTFTKPIANLNFDSLFIELDTVTHLPISKQDISIDVPHKEIKILKSLDKKIFAGENNPRLRLIAKTGFLYSIDSDTSKASSAAIIILWPEETGILFTQTDTSQKNYVIQLIDAGGKVITSALNTPKCTFKNLPPAEYQIRIIIDANKNGRWDPGNIQKGDEPEKVIFYRTAEGKQIFPIRANWELGPLILKF